MSARRFITITVLLIIPLVAEAHPLGNFTINRYTALHLERHQVSARTVVDMAEIPAFQEADAIDRDGDGTSSPPELDAYRMHQAGEIAAALDLTLDGAPVPLVPVASRLEMPPGTGGLPTLRLEIDLRADLTRTSGTLAFRDRTFPDRLGWHEVIADAGDGVVVIESSVPSSDRTNALRSYPTDVLDQPPQVRDAELRFEPGATSSAGARAALAPSASGLPRSDRFAALVTTSAPLTTGFVLLAMLIAAGLGALHALGPGHGKSIVGAYLVGARGTARHAVFLGLTVTATHTIGVYLLGFATLAASTYVLPERLFLWVSVISGVLVVGVGASLAMARLQGALTHDHGHHQHHHAHGAHEHGPYDHDHGHSHLPLVADVDALSWRSLLALGISGGLLPCPSALVVMLGAISLGRIAFGLLLIVAFSAGLAAVLTTIGIVLVYSRTLFDRLPLDGRLVRLVPVASALVIMVAGLAMIAQALAQAGVFHVWA